MSVTVYHDQGLEIEGELVDCFPSSVMPLRDYFAAAALQGLCALDWQSAYQQHMPSAEVYAENAYCIADAMIKAREVSQ